MDLPLRVLPIVERWDCHACGNCCKAHTVFLDAEDLAKIQAQNWDQNPDFRGTPVVVKTGLVGGASVLNQREDGSCVFLMSDGRCRIHAEHGEAAKPWPCQMYPFELIPAEKNVFVTIRRNCPSAAEGKGRKVSEHLDFVRKFRQKVIPETLEIRAPKLTNWSPRDWNVSRLVMGGIEEIMLDRNMPIVRRLVHALWFVEMAGKLKHEVVRQPDFANVLVALEEGSGEEVGALFRDRQQPNAAALTLFRQTAAEYARFHPNLGDRPNARERWRMLLAAFRFARGKGEVPRIHQTLPVTTFEALDRPLGNLPMEVVDPITEFFEATVASGRYCGQGHYDWSILDGFRALALTYPVMLWLIRWLATDETPAFRHSLTAIQMVDRSHEYLYLVGRRHRRRLATLAEIQQLDRLIVWFAR